MKDQQSQQQAWKKLEEYGDSFLDSKDGSRRKMTSLKGKLSKQTAEPRSRTTTTSPEAEPGLSRRQKKRQRKLKKKGMEGEDTRDSPAAVSDGVKKTGSRLQLERLEQELGLAAFRQRLLDVVEAEPEDCVRTAGTGPEIVVFKKHQKVAKDQANTETHASSGDSDRPEFDMKQSRYDVRRLGIQCLEGAKKSRAREALLIQLGAKAEKSKNRNYKEFQAMKRNVRKREMNEREKAREEGGKVPKAPNRKKRKRDRNDVGVVDGQAGKYRSGVQIIKKQELKGFSKSSIKF